MQTRTWVLLLMPMLFVVCWTSFRQTHIFGVNKGMLPLSEDGERWQARAKASADDPQKARQVILSGIYAGRSLTVALAYEQALTEKPKSEIRIANFAHAAVVAGNYPDSELYKLRSNQQFMTKLLDHARNSLKSIILPPDDTTIHTSIERTEQQKFKPTKIADAWLAWANFSGNKQELAYRQALRIDSDFGEAWFGLGHTAIAPQYHTERSVKAHRAVALQQLSRAERLEPRLHPLVVADRASLAIDSGDRASAVVWLREYLRLWPNAPNSAVLQTEVETLKSAKSKPNGEQ